MDVRQHNADSSNIIDIYSSHASETTYWRIDEANLGKYKTLELSGAVQYVTYGHPEYAELPKGNRFVYWPDYKVAGKAKDIAKFFIAHNYPYVQVGELYRISKGEYGNKGRFEVTSKLIMDNAFDPLNYNHRKFINQTVELSQKQPRQHPTIERIKPSHQNLTAESSQELAEIRDNINEAEFTRRNIIDEISEYSRMLKEIKDDIYKAQISYREVGDEISKSRRTLGEIKDDIDKSKFFHHNFFDEIADSSQKLTKLNNDIDTAKISYRKINDDINESMRKLSTIKEAETNYRRITAEISESSRELATINYDIIKAKADHRKIIDETIEATQKLAKIKDDVDRIKMPLFNTYDLRTMGRILTDQYDKIVIIYWVSDDPSNSQFLLFNPQQSDEEIINQITKNQYQIYYVFEDNHLFDYPDVSFITFVDDYLTINILINRRKEKYIFLDEEIYGRITGKLIPMLSPIQELLENRDIL